MKIPVIKSKMFILRPFRKGDEKLLAKNANNKKISRANDEIPYPYTLKHAKEYILENKKELRKKKPVKINFAIDIDDEVVGSIGLVDIKEKHRAEIGYWLSEKYWNKGIMTEVVKLITKFGFEKLKLKRIEIYVFAFNKASIKVAKKNRYKLEGILRKSSKRGNKFIDDYAFAKLR